MRHSLTVILVAAALSACGGGESAPEAAELYVPMGSLQCMGGGTPLLEWRDVGSLPPVCRSLASSCGLDGQAHATVCGRRIRANRHRPTPAARRRRRLHWGSCPLARCRSHPGALRVDSRPMPRYVAFLRGVSPSNARMADLKRAFERDCGLLGGSNAAVERQRRLRCAIGHGPCAAATGRSCDAGASCTKLAAPSCVPARTFVRCSRRTIPFHRVRSPAFGQACRHLPSPAGRFESRSADRTRRSAHPQAVGLRGLLGLRSQPRGRSS